ncbi:MAG: MFS transporter [Bacillota bacterium]
MKEPAEFAASGNGQEFLTNLINFLLYFAIMLSLIFIPLYGAELGASDFQVGLVVGAYGTAFLLSSLFFGWKSDSFGRLRFVRYGLLITGLAFLSQILAGNLLLLVISRAFVGFTLGIVTAALLAYVYESVGHLGKFSSYGSLGWIFGALAAGLLKDYRLLFAVSAVFTVLAFLLSFRLKETSGRGETAAPDLLAVLRRNRRVYLAIFLRHLGAQAVWAILPLYLVWLGADKFWVGLLWGINFGVQFIVMRYIEKFDAGKVFTFGQVVSLLVFLAYVLATDYRQLVVVQAALGLSWSCLYVGALLIVLESGEERGTASGIFQSTLNLCNALGPFIGGAIAQGWGYRGAMLFAVFIGLAGLGTALPGPKKALRETAGKPLP